jgi:hypothetical protein
VLDVICSLRHRHQFALLLEDEGIIDEPASICRPIDVLIVDPPRSTANAGIEAGTAGVIYDFIKFVIENP